MTWFDCWRRSINCDATNSKFISFYTPPSEEIKFVFYRHCFSLTSHVWVFLKSFAHALLCHSIFNASAVANWNKFYAVIESRLIEFPFIKNCIYSLAYFFRFVLTGFRSFGLRNSFRMQYSINVGVSRVRIRRVAEWWDNRSSGDIRWDDWRFSDVSCVQSVEVSCDILRARADDIRRHDLSWGYEHLRLWLGWCKSEECEDEDCQLKRVKS